MLTASSPALQAHSAAPAPAGERLSCWHCRDTMRPDERVDAEVAGQLRAFCCHGCQAAASWIAQAGLVDYYRLRDAVQPTPDDDGAGRRAVAGPETLQALESLVPDLERHVVRALGDGRAEVMLVIEGIRCAACAWLIERVLTAHAGVRSVEVNPVALRARIVYEPARVGLRALLESLVRAGYRPVPLERQALDDARGRESRAALKRLLVAGFGMMQAMMFAAVLYVGGDSLDEATRSLFRWLGFAAASPVVLYSAGPFFSGAIRALRLRAISVDVPVALAIALIYLASLWVALRGGVEVYFDSVAMFVFFLLCGRQVEMRARHRAGDLGDSISRLTPAFADRIGSDGAIERVAVAALRKADRVVVAAGQAVPADGVVAAGQGSVDESLLTGESRPVDRTPGTALMAGSLVITGPLEMTVGEVGEDTALAAIVALVRRAQLARPRLARVGERAAGAFIIRVMVLSCATAGLWAWFDPSRAFDAALAVLVVSCPCAFALAVPAVLTRAMAVLAGRGILVVNPDAIEGLATADQVIFDKTGTLTDRRLAVSLIDVQRPGLTRAEALARAAALAGVSRHPVSRAIAVEHEATRARAGDGDGAAIRLVPAVDCVDHRGEGVEGIVAGQRLRLGKPAFALALASGTADGCARTSVNGCATALADDGAVVLADADGAQAFFHLSEVVRRDAEATVSMLSLQGLSAEIASGDAAPRVDAVARELGIDAWSARLLPADKLARLSALREAGRRSIVVGDGINDAPVLSGADVSVAMASGADLAQASSDVVLVGERLRPLADAVAVARRATAILRQNQRWAMVYNFSAVPLAALGFVPPWLAALGMSLSSLLVVLNSLRIDVGPNAWRARPQR